MTLESTFIILAGINNVLVKSFRMEVFTFQNF